MCVGASMFSPPFSHPAALSNVVVVAICRVLVEVRLLIAEVAAHPL